MSFKIDIKGLDVVSRKIEKLGAKVQQGVEDAITTFILEVKEDAVQRVPKNESALNFSIQADLDNIKKLQGSVKANIEYAAFVEFGTKKFAAAYVATLPPDWQAYAKRFKGSGSGNYRDFMVRLMMWMKKKGIEEKFAYPIARKILRDGTKAQPFLYPAFTNEPRLARLEQDLKDIVK